jgi:hypothetical protein
MPDRPRVIGLEELLALKKPLRERPAPMVYFSDDEFTGLLAGGERLEARPRARRPLATFLPWSGGGVVQASCTSPPGQICFGQWTPEGRGHGAGTFLGCVCKGLDGTTVPPPKETCRLVLRPNGQFACSGACNGLQTCRLGYYKDPATGVYALDCRCRTHVLGTQS